MCVNLATRLLDKKNKIRHEYLSKEVEYESNLVTYFFI
jgi:hypothetical protein